MCIVIKSRKSFLGAEVTTEDRSRIKGKNFIILITEKGLKNIKETTFESKEEVRNNAMHGSTSSVSGRANVLENTGGVPVLTSSCPGLQQVPQHF